jgi:hypothetical protein
MFCLYAPLFLIAVAAIYGRIYWRINWPRTIEMASRLLCPHCGQPFGKKAVKRSFEALAKSRREYAKQNVGKWPRYLPVCPLECSYCKAITEFNYDLHMLLPYATVRNCDFAYRATCTSSWEQLYDSSEPNVKYCGICKQKVYRCLTDAEVIEHAERNERIALDTGSLTLPEQTPPQVQQTLLSGRSGDALRDFQYTARCCEKCGYAFPEWRKTCKVCGFKPEKRV